MMTRWFTADTHFWHTNVIKHCSRPYASIEDMNESLIERWNSVVGHKDEVFHLGDFAFCGKERSGELLSRLKGRKHLIIGNHDKVAQKLSGWESVATRREFKVGIDGKPRLVVLDHYPLLSWNASFHGSLMFHGHSHGAIPATSRRIDVGVDCWDYRPASLEEIVARMSSLPDPKNLL